MESERDKLIREKAYQLWEEGGRHEGRAEEHWAAAERSVGPKGAKAAGKADAAAKPGKPAKDAAAAGDTAPPARKPAKAAAAEQKAELVPAAKAAGKGRGKGGTSSA